MLLLLWGEKLIGLKRMPLQKILFNWWALLYALEVELSTGTALSGTGSKLRSISIILISRSNYCITFWACCSKSMVGPTVVQLLCNFKSIIFL